MEKKYGALRLVATIYRILGWVVIVFGVLGACTFLFLTATSGAALFGVEGARAGAQAGAGALFGGILGFVWILLWSALVGLGLFAFAELIYVILDIEGNTRAMAEGMKKPGS